MGVPVNLSGALSDIERLEADLDGFKNLSTIQQVAMAGDFNGRVRDIKRILDEFPAPGLYARLQIAGQRILDEVYAWPETDQERENRHAEAAIACISYLQEVLAKLPSPEADEERAHVQEVINLLSDNDPIPTTMEAP
jgi:hypothetical protein